MRHVSRNIKEIRTRANKIQAKAKQIRTAERRIRNNQENSFIYIIKRLWCDKETQTFYIPKRMPYIFLSSLDYPDYRQTFHLVYIFQIQN